MAAAKSFREMTLQGLNGVDSDTFRLWAKARERDTA
ncbi:MAG: hypothetical protein RLY69_204 [Verrucomicrobiota bacterium]|jgi:hypothetical protein